MTPFLPPPSGAPAAPAAPALSAATLAFPHTYLHTLPNSDSSFTNVPKGLAEPLVVCVGQTQDAAHPMMLIKLPTGATINNIASLSTLAGFTSGKYIRATYKPHFFARVKIYEVTNLRFWAGIFNTTPSAADTVSNYAVCGMRFSTSAGDTTFKAVVSGAGGTSSVVYDTGQAVAGNTIYDIGWEFNVDDSITAFAQPYGGVKKTVLIPASDVVAISVTDGPEVSLKTLDAVTKNVSINQMLVTWGRS